MHEVKIINTGHPTKNEFRAQYCASFLCLLKGLSFRKSISVNWGLLLVHPSENRIESSIHMLGMKFDLGIIWINADGEVVDKKLAKKWVSFLFPRHPAKYVLEALPVHMEDFHVGDRLKFENIS